MTIMWPCQQDRAVALLDRIAAGNVCDYDIDGSRVIRANDAQHATLEALASHLDFEETEFTTEKNGTVIFEGYSVDGLCVGIIETDGKVDWVAGEVAL